MCRPPYFAVLQADQRRHLVRLSQRIRGINATPRMPTRCPPRAAEHQCLRRIRRRCVLRSAPIRRRRKTGVRHPALNIDRSLPGVGRANPRSRPEHDAPVFAGRWLRAPGSQYRMHGAIDRRGRRRHTLRVNGRRARLLSRHGPFTHRRNPCGARCAARARQKEQRGFLRSSR